MARSMDWPWPWLEYQVHPVAAAINSGPLILPRLRSSTPQESFFPASLLRVGRAISASQQESPPMPLQQQEWLSPLISPHDKYRVLSSLGATLAQWTMMHLPMRS